MRRDKYTQKRDLTAFPVLMKDHRIASALELSETLQHLPIVAVNYVFVEPSKLDQARNWLDANRESLIQPKDTEELS